jgi:Ca2+:H+ antiporter
VTATTTRRRGPFTAGDLRLIGLTVLATAGAAVTHYIRVGPVVPFVVAAASLALLATLVGRSVEALGERLGSGATGILQSALGNLPELLILSFALHQGLLTVVHTALIGSILANLLLVLGLAFIAGGLRHGTQTFGQGQARMLSVMMLLSAAALLIPSLTSQLHTPAASHEGALSVGVSVLLLVVFGLSLPFALSAKESAATAGDPAAAEAARQEHATEWPLGVAILVLALTGVLAAVASDWFVSALEPAIKAMHISDGFAGLVIVAIAGNAVENVVGIQLALKNRADYALSVILQSPLQIALVVAPVLVLLSYAIAAQPLTLVFPPLLVAALAIGAIVTVVVVVDGESNWLEGAVLVGLYGIIATAFWWG